MSGPPRLTDFVSGSLAGAAGTLASMPCDTIRTRLVSQGEPKVRRFNVFSDVNLFFLLFTQFQIYRGVVHALISMIRKEGFLSLYNGLVPSLALIMPQTGVQFASFRLFVESYWVLHGGGSMNTVNGSLLKWCNIFFPFFSIFRDEQQAPIGWEFSLRQLGWTRSENICLSSRFMQKTIPGSRF